MRKSIRLIQWFPTFFDGGPNLIFQVSWRATEVSSTFSCLHDGRLRAPSAYTSSFKRIWEVYPVASFEFYKKASQVCPLLSTQAQVHPTWRAPPVLKPHILPSSLPQPSPAHPAPKPQICTVFLLPLSALKPHLFHLSFPTFPQNHAATDVSSPTGSVWGRAPAANDFSAF